MAAMKDPHEVLRQKEMDMDRVRREVQALRGVIPLLEEQALHPVEMMERATSSPSIQRNRWPLDLGEVESKI